MSLTQKDEIDLKYNEFLEQQLESGRGTLVEAEMVADDLVEEWLDAMQDWRADVAEDAAEDQR